MLSGLLHREPNLGEPELVEQFRLKSGRDIGLLERELSIGEPELVEHVDFRLEPGCEPVVLEHGELGPGDSVELDRERDWGELLPELELETRDLEKRDGRQNLRNIGELADDDMDPLCQPLELELAYPVPASERPGGLDPAVKNMGVLRPEEESSE